jgi:hypothetical protein
VGPDPIRRPAGHARSRPLPSLSSTAGLPDGWPAWPQRYSEGVALYGGAEQRPFERAIVRCSLDIDDTVRQTYAHGPTDDLAE